MCLAGQMRGRYLLRRIAGSLRSRNTANVHQFDLSALVHYVYHRLANRRLSIPGWSAAEVPQWMNANISGTNLS
ncbi:MAG TPA: hypothetical protein VGM27_11545 [Acidobacteriaceae bacterium]|jgi:hypothetical protein